MTRDQYEIALDFARADEPMASADEVLKRARVYLDFLQNRGEGMAWPAYYSKGAPGDPRTGH